VDPGLLKPTSCGFRRGHEQAGEILAQPDHV
jgi:hypothetical protein